MRIGTKSVLYGYHCFLIHGWFVLAGWFSLHGFRRVRIGTTTKHDVLQRAVFTSLLDYRLWLAAFLHDFGYWGKPNMDGPEGETHPEWAATFMRKRFGDVWGDFCLYHSRFYAKSNGAVPSALCFADKVAFLKYPTWLIILLVSRTGEVHEYLQNASRDSNGQIVCDGQRHNSGALPTYTEWAEGVKTFVRQWVAEHKDGAADTVTRMRVS